MRSQPMLSSKMKTCEYDDENGNQIPVSDFYVEGPQTDANQKMYYNPSGTEGNLRVKNVTEFGLQKLLKLVDFYADEVLNKKSGCGGTQKATPDIMNSLIEIQEHTRKSLNNSDSLHYNL